MEKILPYNPAQEDLARNIKRGRKGVHIVYFPSRKNSRVIVCESKLEADFCQWLEFDPEVISYKPQPVTICIRVEGKIKEYTPDFQVSYRLRPDVFYEVKPASVNTWDDYMEMMKQVEQHFIYHGVGFKLKLDTEIRIEPFLGNLKFLYSKIHHVTENETNYLIHCMTRLGGEAAYHELLGMAGAPSLGALAKAIYDKLIDVDLSTMFDQSTRLHMNLPP